jgi:WD40 repeat protein
VTGVLSAFDAAVFLCGDGALHLVESDLSHAVSQVHRGAILAGAIMPNGSVLTGGDDGCVKRTAADGHSELVSEHAGQWIDCVASSASGAIAWSAGRKVYYRDPTGAVKHVECPSTPAALTFDPKGRHLAIAHYGGVWLWLPKAKRDVIRKLTWKGSHLRVTWSPDGRYVLTAMQEHEIHGWRLSDRAHMRMAGYPGKIHSLSWHHSGRLLATSGGPTAIIWPFDESGPWHRKPAELGFSAAGFSEVAWHPRKDLLACGCAMGSVQIAAPSEPQGAPIREASRGSVTGLSWVNQGKALAIGTTKGNAEIHSIGVG